MKKYNLYVSEQQLEWLQSLSKETGLSVSEIIRRAIDDYRSQKDVPVATKKKAVQKS